MRKVLQFKLRYNEHIRKKEQLDSFTKLMSVLFSKAILCDQDLKNRTQVIADPSPVELAAVLIHCDDRGRDPRIIVLLADCEERYCQS